MTDPQDIIPLATTILRDLAHKPREQIQYTPEGLHVLKALSDMRMVKYTIMSNLPEQNIWTIESTGLDWLHKHGLLP